MTTMTARFDKVHLRIVKLTAYLQVHRMLTRAIEDLDFGLAIVRFAASFQQFVPGVHP
jgi:hypothetical protein